VDDGVGGGRGHDDLRDLLGGHDDLRDLLGGVGRPPARAGPIIEPSQPARTEPLHPAVNGLGIHALDDRDLADAIARCAVQMMRACSPIRADAVRERARR
jgi:hypothetical protein